MIAALTLAVVALSRSRRATEASSRLQDRLAEIILALEVQGQDIAGLRQQLARPGCRCLAIAATRQPTANERLALPRRRIRGTAPRKKKRPATSRTPPIPDRARARACRRCVPARTILRRHRCPHAQPVPPGPRWARGGLERQFGAVLPVWIGGIALAFAGFFLVKYSIENELIGPHMRVVLGCCWGLR